MPQIFKIGSFWIYFWSNEGVPAANATKIWITRARKCLLANNNSRINPHVLQNILRIIEARHEDVVAKWVAHFNEISYFC